jgi:predicted nucleic acid-binding protein
MVKVYFDACCLNRPFDDQSQERIKLETEAILLVLLKLESGNIQWINSEVLEYEIHRMPDKEKQQKIETFFNLGNKKVLFGKGEENRAKELKGLGFNTYDSFHIACAESGGADVFLTTDDMLIKMSKKNNDKLKVKVKNPINWIAEE